MCKPICLALLGRKIEPHKMWSLPLTQDLPTVSKHSDPRSSRWEPHGWWWSCVTIVLMLIQFDIQLIGSLFSLYLWLQKSPSWKVNSEVLDLFCFLRNGKWTSSNPVTPCFRLIPVLLEINPLTILSQEISLRPASVFTPQTQLVNPQPLSSSYWALGSSEPPRETPCVLNHFQKPPWSS